MPVLLNGERSGFEVFHDAASDTIDSFGRGNFDRAWTFALGFRWLGSSLNELLAAWMAATAYADVTRGVVFDHEEGRLLSPQEARQIVQIIAGDIPRMEAILADIKAKYSRRLS